MTKSLLTVAMLLVALAELCAQAPEAFKYQAVARDAAGEPLVNTPVNLILLVYSTPPPGLADYVEGHFVSTNDNGLFELVVGQGAPYFGAFSSIDWTSGSNFLEVELFETSGNTFIKLGIQQLVSVPYAMHSGTSDPWGSNGADIYNANNGNVGIGTATPEISAALELKSTTQGFLPPRMTGAERDAIASPEAGLIIWCTDCGNGAGMMQMYFGSGWKTIEGGSTVPSVVTVDVAVGSLTGTKAKINANIVNDGGAFVYASGICWSSSPEPTIALATKTIDGTGFGTFTSPITGLDTNTTYYVRAYATNLNGTFYGNELTFTTTDHMIGDPFQGGILAYFLQPGDPGYDANVPHGLIVAPTDQAYTPPYGSTLPNTSAPWGCFGTSTAATDSTLGTGQMNTVAIVSAGCSNANDAARLCADLVVNGYDDWYLPSKHELKKLQINRVAVLGINYGFGNYDYWSSTQLLNSTDAWKHYFPDNVQWAQPINSTGDVRAFRSF